MTTPSSAIIYVDGGSRGNPGPAGAGAIISSGSAEICAISKFLGVTTNNVAEYTGLVLALEKALELGLTDIQVYMDSELIVKQMNGVYRVKNQGLMPFFQRARQFASKFASFKIDHVRREYNKIADRLANEAMDLGTRERSGK
jgi:ribonuclease HI